MDLAKKDFKARRKPGVDLSTMVYGKVPPQAKELEEAVLGALMLEKGAFDTVIEILKAECFYVDAHQKLFSAMQRLAGKSMPVDILTVVEELKSSGDLEAVGGPFFVSRLTNMVVSTANIEAHARIVLKSSSSASSSASPERSSPKRTKIRPTYSTCSTPPSPNSSKLPTTTFAKTTIPSTGSS